MHLLLDLDDTLYSPSSRLNYLIRYRTKKFISIYFNISFREAESQFLEYINKFGTALSGLIEGENINAEEFMAFVFEIDVRRFIKPNLKLKNIFDKFCLTKSIFSNSPREHIESVIKELGINKQIQNIFGRRFLKYNSKPNPLTYKLVIDTLGTKGNDCIIVDDRDYNLDRAKDFAMITVLVSPTQKIKSPNIDFHINTINKIDSVLY